MRTKWDVSAALMCKQFLKEHFLFKVWKERRSLNELQQMCIVTMETSNKSVEKSCKITTI